LSQIKVEKNFSLRNAISQKKKKLAAPNEVKFVGKYSHLEPFSADFNLVPLRSRLCLSFFVEGLNIRLSQLSDFFYHLFTLGYYLSDLAD
jgi:hypothetical protein